MYGRASKGAESGSGQHMMRCCHKDGWGQEWGGDIPPPPWASDAVSAFQGSGATSLCGSCFPVGPFAPRSHAGKPPSYSEHRNSCFAALLHTHACALTHVEDLLLPGRKKNTRATSTDFRLCPAGKVYASSLEQ